MYNLTDGDVVYIEKDNGKWIQGKIYSKPDSMSIVNQVEVDSPRGCELFDGMDIIIDGEENTVMWSGFHNQFILVSFESIGRIVKKW